jgi:hypothetical protein
MSHLDVLKRILKLVLFIILQELKIFLLKNTFNNLLISLLSAVMGFELRPSAMPPDHFSLVISRKGLFCLR